MVISFLRYNFKQIFSSKAIYIRIEVPRIEQCTLKIFPSFKYITPYYYIAGVGVY